MKPLPIADYLDHLGRGPSEKASPRREGSPFRPRTLASPPNGEPRSIPAFDHMAETEAGGVGDRQGEERPQRAPWGRKPIPLDSAARQRQAAREAAETEETAARVAEAHARGREEGLAEGRAEALERHAAELAAAQEQALMQARRGAARTAGLSVDPIVLAACFPARLGPARKRRGGR